MSVAPFRETAPTGSLEFNLRFAGQYYDKERGTHYNINRDYNPVTGRYIQSDPIGLDGGLSTFAYVNGNPVMLVDLEGLCGSSDEDEPIVEHFDGYIFKTSLTEKNTRWVSVGRMKYIKVTLQIIQNGGNMYAHARFRIDCSNCYRKPYYEIKVVGSNIVETMYAEAGNPINWEAIVPAQPRANGGIMRGYIQMNIYGKN
jgi:RHS repeat-associated protein